jgi:predicted secreted hydrolase
LSGTWIAPDGTSTLLSASDITLTGSKPWTSPTSGGKYPQTWQIAIPRFGFDATVLSEMPNQELHTTGSTGITYWEGAVSVAGSHTGEGYLEMTGYVENVGARF